MPNGGKNDPTNAFVAKGGEPQSQGRVMVEPSPKALAGSPAPTDDTWEREDEKRIAHGIVMDQRGGYYKDRIKKEPFSQLESKPKPMVPKQPMKRA